MTDRDFAYDGAGHRVAQPVRVDPDLVGAEAVGEFGSVVLGGEYGVHAVGDRGSEDGPVGVPERAGSARRMCAGRDESEGGTADRWVGFRSSP